MSSKQEQEPKPGLNVRVFRGLVPPPEWSEYSFTFMTGMRVSGIYRGELFNGPDEWVVAPCVRTDGLRRSGKSERHLTTFNMLGLAARKDWQDALVLNLRMIKDLIGHEVGVKIVLPEELKKALEDSDGDFDVDNSLYFDREDTDRKGPRIEIRVVGGVDWEVMNVVVLNQKSNEDIRPPIINSGGSLERLLAINEGKKDVFETSIFPKEIRSEKKLDETTKRRLLDLGRTLLFLEQGISKKGRKFQKKVWSGFLKLCLDYGVDFSDILRQINKRGFLGIGLRGDKWEFSFSRILEEDDLNGVLKKLDDRIVVVIKGEEKIGYLVDRGEQSHPSLPRQKIYDFVFIAPEGIKYTEEFQEVGLASLALVYPNGKVLLLKRIVEGKEYFDFPGGGVENGEDVILALKREVKEETGLELPDDVWERIGLASWNRIVFDGQNRLKVTFILRLPKGFVVPPVVVDKDPDDDIKGYSLVSLKCLRELLGERRGIFFNLAEEMVVRHWLRFI